MIDDDMALDCLMRSTGGNFSKGSMLVESSIPDLVITKSLFTPKNGLFNRSFSFKQLKPINAPTIKRMDNDKFTVANGTGNTNINLNILYQN